MWNKVFFKIEKNKFFSEGIFIFWGIYLSILFFLFYGKELGEYG